MEILETRVRATGVIVKDSPGMEQLADASRGASAKGERQTAYLY
ncbi:hypothetical protein [Thauera sp.]